MWQVVVRRKGKEDVSEAMSYFDAFASYESKALNINAKDKNGEYLYPNDRVSLRKYVP